MYQYYVMLILSNIVSIMLILILLCGCITIVDSLSCHCVREGVTTDIYLLPC